MLATKVCEHSEDGSAAIPIPTYVEAGNALDRFRRGLPAIGHLPNLVNAGWLGYLDSEIWTDKPAWGKNKFRFRNELVFKSLDVTEFDERGREDAAKI